MIFKGGISSEIKIYFIYFVYIDVCVIFEELGWFGDMIVLQLRFQLYVVNIFIIFSMVYRWERFDYEYVLCVIYYKII